VYRIEIPVSHPMIRRITPRTIIFPSGKASDAVGPRRAHRRYPGIRPTHLV
jgi:hypothetical protein